MTQSLFLPHNYADLGTFAASSTASGSFAAANVQDPQRSHRWRSGAGTTSYLDLTRATADEVDWAALVDVNLRPTGSIRVQSWSDALGGASPGADVTVSPTTRAEDIGASGYGAGGYGAGGYGSVSALRPAKGNVTLIPLGADYDDLYWRFTFTDNDSSYQECGRVFLSKSLSFAINPSYQWDLVRNEIGGRLETIGGQFYPKVVNSRRQFTGQLEYLTDAETGTFLRSHELLGDSTPLVFSLRPDNDDIPVSIYGTYREVRASGKTKNMNSVGFSVLEDL